MDILAACISAAKDMLRLGLFIYQKRMVHLIPVITAMEREAS